MEKSPPSTKLKKLWWFCYLTLLFWESLRRCWLEISNVVSVCSVRNMQQVLASSDEMGLSMEIICFATVPPISFSLWTRCRIESWQKARWRSCDDIYLLSACGSLPWHIVAASPRWLLLRKKAFRWKLDFHLLPLLRDALKRWFEREKEKLRRTWLKTHKSFGGKGKKCATHKRWIDN